MNRIAWYGKEVEMKDLFELQCAETEAKRYVISGAVPSVSKFIPQKDLVVDDMPDREAERVNVPSHMWTVACCDKSAVRSGARSFFTGHVAENKAGGQMEVFTDLDRLTTRVSHLYNYTVQILADGCGGGLDNEPFG